MSLINFSSSYLQRLTQLMQKKSGRKSRRAMNRSLRTEQLDARSLFAADLVLLHNSVIAEDVNNDGSVSMTDAMLVSRSIAQQEKVDARNFTDVNKDGRRNSLDVLQIINRINHDLHRTQSSQLQNKGQPTGSRKANQPTNDTQEYRSADGSGNNIANPELGTPGQALKRVAEPDYGDGISTSAGAERPSARQISNELSDIEGDGLRSDRGLSAFIYVWGQFIDHDIDLTETQINGEKFPIAVPKGDTSFDPSGTGTASIALTRSQYDATTGTSTSNPREQISAITAYIDGSQVYGSDQATADGLRTFVGGRLKITSDGLIPQDESGMVIAGDIRASENISLTAIQTLFVREHNRLAKSIAAKDRSLTDEQVYQQARALVIAEIQSITYNEFLPALLGTRSISQYRGYDSTVDPTVANEFSTAAFRFGHSTLNDDIGFFDNNGRDVREEIELKDAFFNPSLLEETGIDSLLKYEASSQSQEIDLAVIDGLRNFLFGDPGQGGLDLVALNIQRGRDHGLSDYNSTRVAYGLTAVKSFADITSNVELQNKLQALYEGVDNIDLWVGLLAEDHLAGSSVGKLTQKIISDQFTRLRDGDRFYFENIFKGQQLNELKQTTLANIIQRNTTVRGLQQNVFFMKAEASGRITTSVPRTTANQSVSFARPDNGISQAASPATGVARVTVELLNSQDEVIATTVTDRRGNYRFTSFEETGEYKVRIAETTKTLSFSIKNGEARISGLNFRLASKG